MNTKLRYGLRGILRTIFFMLAFLLSSSLFAQERILKVSGKITDELDGPVIGANIKIAGTRLGVVSDNEGKYQISVAPTDSLEFSFVGYKTVKLAVRNRVDLNVKLEADAGGLNEVSIVGYGQQKKISVIGAQSTLEAKDLKLPVRDIAGMLGGRISGMITTSRGGGPGEDNSGFLVRGVSTFGTSTRTPLIIIDGVPDRTLNDIDPEDIQTFTVLKDAVSTAVYGTRGANGVIIINTKKGTIGKPAVNFELNQGVSQFVQVPELLDAPTWMTLYNEALTTRGRAALYTDERINLHRTGADPDLYPNVNWYDEIFRKSGVSQRANLNISGGSDKSTYYISAGYYRETGLLKENPDSKNYDVSSFYKRYNFTANIGVNVTNTTKLDLGISSIIDQRNGPASSETNALNNLFAQVLRVPPHVIPGRYSNGVYTQYPGGFSSPTKVAFNFGSKNDYSATIRPNIRVKQDLGILTKGLSISGLFSFDIYTDGSTGTGLADPSYYATERDANGNLILQTTRDASGTYTFSSARSSTRRMYTEASLNYGRTFGKHEVGGLLLFNQSEYIDGNAATFISSVPFRNRGITGRATYGYNNRYFVEGNFGYTGSENFSPAKRFGFFPSVGVGYIVSNEKFYDAIKSVVPYFKLRYSYGLTGNGGFSTRFLYLTQLAKTTATGYQFGIPSSLSPAYSGYAESQIATDPSWETSYRHNLGIELNFFKNDLKLVTELFREKRKGILRADQTIPGLSGFGGVNPTRNIGIVLNKGIDVTLTYNKSLSNRKWINITSTFTYNDNTNLEDGLPPQRYPWMEWKGKEVDAKTLYIAEGLFKDQAEVAASAFQSGDTRPGDIKYSDLNKDGIIDANDVARIDVSGTPKMMYGINLAFGIKGFDFGAFIQGTGKVYLNYGIGDGTRPFASGPISGGLMSMVADRWTESNPNPNAFYPRLNTNQDPNLNYLNSTWWLKSADFIRLKSAEIGYTLNQSFIKRYGIKNVRVFINGTNLITLSKWKFWDPELNDTGTSSNNYSRGESYPNIKAYNLGARVTF
ncbi:SusC/RagA family TonB-linked outer membrane protein [Pedobacter sp. LMG 31464]|uniref:SusC/RagA family TonB-linked outer membrane protein n=1 Tax=Pedobacter planticolens TaxID=2679964 RepID=A0A923DZP6_9SPHI|nr:TonB-dependent receptor [Pedobacter planticolens]MBB2144924.1 SusC/RagA family TonB-linked outer membrane protein [Pedobacter planticolens]